MGTYPYITRLICRTSDLMAHKPVRTLPPSLCSLPQATPLLGETKPPTLVMSNSRNRVYCPSPRYRPGNLLVVGGNRGVQLCS